MNEGEDGGLAYKGLGQRGAAFYKKRYIEYMADTFEDHSTSPLILSTSPHLSDNSVDNTPWFPLHTLKHPFLSTTSKDS